MELPVFANQVRHHLQHMITMYTGISVLAVRCAPPRKNCNNIRLDDESCCYWTCLDDLLPNEGTGIDNQVADIKLRLMASSLTAIFSVALLLFLIYRLRTKRLQGAQRRQEDDLSVDSALEQGAGAYPMSTPRSHWHPLGWWKPQPNLFDGRPAPPSYDDAMMQSNTRDPGGPGGGSSNSSLESQCSAEEAPPYSEIQRDPIIQEQMSWYGHLRQPMSAASNHPQQPSQHHHTVGIPLPSRPATVPRGAALVLPVPAPSQNTLQHVEPKAPSADASQTPPTISPTGPGRTQSSVTLPPSLRRMRARSREGIVLPPEERDLVLQRFSLELNLNISASSSSLSSCSTSPTVQSPRRNGRGSDGRRRIKARSTSPPKTRN